MKLKKKQNKLEATEITIDPGHETMIIQFLKN
jgi:hypothetical protein